MASMYRWICPVPWRTTRVFACCLPVIQDHKIGHLWMILQVPGFRFDHPFPIPSMGLVYLPTWMVDFMVNLPTWMVDCLWVNVGKYTVRPMDSIHGFLEPTNGRSLENSRCGSLISINEKPLKPAFSSCLKQGTFLCFTGRSFCLRKNGTNSYVFHGCFNFLVQQVVFLLTLWKQTNNGTRERNMLVL